MMLLTISQLFERAYSKGWITQTQGTASFRSASDSFFYITPSDWPLLELRPEFFKKIAIHRSVVESKNCQIRLVSHESEVIPHTPFSSALTASPSLPLHFGIQKELGPDSTRICLHVHPTYTLAAMLCGLNINQIVSQFSQIHQGLSIAPAAGSCQSLGAFEMAELCHEALGVQDDGTYQYALACLPNNGVVSVASTPQKAFAQIESLEQMCQIALIARGLNL